MSATSGYLRKMREKRDIHGYAREILRLLIRARGAVTLRLIRYHVWERHGVDAPMQIHVYIAHIRAITGLGIRHYLPDRCVALCPDWNEDWCRPEIWEVVGA